MYIVLIYFFIQLICLILIMKLTAARFGYVPKFFGENSAIIVDTDKLWLANSNNKAVNYANKIRFPAPFPLWHHYQRYRILPPPPPLHQQVLAINTWSKTKPTKPLTTTTRTTIPSTTSTTTTTRPITFTTTTTVLPTSSIPSPLPSLSDDEFPKELLDIAQNKLGLKSLDEIPSLSELGLLLGTNTPKETLNYIQQLTSNDQGVALMKAYIESADYTDNSGNFKNKNDDDDYYADGIGDTDETFKLNDEGLVVIKDEDLNDYNVNEKKTILKPRKASKIIQKLRELPKTHHASFMERIANFMHLNNLFGKPVQKEETQIQDKEDNVVSTSTTEISKSMISKENHASNDDDFDNQTELTREMYSDSILSAPLLETNPIPFNYPVPIRVESSTVSTIITTAGNNTSVVHLNTPKILIPHVQKLAHVTKLPTKEIENFLTSKPKLLELATKISRFPLGYDRNSPMEAQVMSVVQKAIEEDEDLRKLLNSTATLK